MDKEDLKNLGEKAEETAKEAGEKISEAAKTAKEKISEGYTSMKEKIVAKLSEENAATPEQKIKNLEAKAAAADVNCNKLEMTLGELKDESEKLSGYIEKAKAAGDTAKAQQFETKLNDIAEKVVELKEKLEKTIGEKAAVSELIADIEGENR